jgi:hypothetical protein
LGVGGTPAIYINGVPVDFNKLNVESMRQIIDSDFKKRGLSRQVKRKSSDDCQSISNTAIVVNNNAAKNTVGNSTEKK